MTPYRRGKGLAYYVQITHKGRRIQYNTGAEDYQQAVAEGMRKAAELKMGVVLRPHIPEGVLTLQKIVDTYIEDAVGVQEDTKSKNVNSLKRVLAPSGLTLDAKPADLTRQAIIRFQSYWTKTHPNGAASANSAVRQARSIFSRRCMPMYEALGSINVDGFMKQPLLKEPRRQYTPPDQGTLDRLFAAVQEIKRNDPPMYAAFLLACYTGMRAGEMNAAQWSWIKYTADMGSAYVEVPAEFSKSNANRFIPVSKEIVTELKRLTDDGPFLIPARTEHSRHELIYRKHSQWLASLGMKRFGKTNHELRKYFGATIATEQGLFAAQKTLGHSSPKLTSDVYAALIKLPDPIPLRQQVCAPSSRVDEALSV